MKIKIFIFLSLLFISIAGISQNKGDVRVGTYGEVIVFGNKILPQYGISGEWFVADNISLNYKYGLGKNQDGDFSGHFNPALFLLAFTVGYPSAALGTLLISEGVSYHFNLNEFIEIAPYLNPLGAEVNLYQDKPIVLSCAFGVNMYFKQITPFKNICLAPRLGAILIYRDVNVLPVAGFSLNYTFN